MFARTEAMGQVAKVVGGSGREDVFEDLVLLVRERAFPLGFTSALDLIFRR